MKLLRRYRRFLISTLMGFALGLALQIGTSTAQAQSCHSVNCDYWCVDMVQCSTCLQYAPCWIEYGRCVVDEICGQSTIWRICGFCMT
jgi:hypothetical protein